MLPELTIRDAGGDHTLAPVALSDQYAYYAKSVKIAQPQDVSLLVGIRSGTGQLLIDNVIFGPVPANVEIEMDNLDPQGVTAPGVTFTGASWDNTRTNPSANKGTFALNTRKDCLAGVIYTPPIPVSGLYDVYEWHHSVSGTTDAPYTVNSAQGSTTLRLTQTANGNKWNKLGTFPFEEGASGSVVIMNGQTTSNFILADGMKFVRVGISRNCPR